MDESSSMVARNSDERWEMDHRQGRLGRRGITVLTLVLLILAAVVGAVLLYRYR
jgi:hypothetical protein